MDNVIPAKIKTGAEARAYAERMEAARRRRTRLRLAALAGLLLFGLSLGAIYATGFATTGGTTGSTQNATPLSNNPGDAQDTSGLNGLISTGCAGCSANLTWNYSGRFGSVPSAVMYDVNLTNEPLANNYFVAVYLSNAPAGYSDLQLQIRIATDGADNACTTADLSNTTTVGTGSGNYRNMIFDTNDAQITFQGWVASGNAAGSGGLDGGERYCVGIYDYPAGPSNVPPAAGRDPSGTFIRRVNTATTPTPPTFVATLNQMP
ncbi:MAG TPA: hypothetical protein VFY99_00755 [Solirubrobacterales bacterium]